MRISLYHTLSGGTPLTELSIHVNCAPEQKSCRTVEVVQVGAVPLKLVVKRR